MKLCLPLVLAKVLAATGEYFSNIFPDRYRHQNDFMFCSRFGLHALIKMYRIPNSSLMKIRNSPFMNI